jgi:hypothetical protein
MEYPHQWFILNLWEGRLFQVEARRAADVPSVWQPALVTRLLDWRDYLTAAHGQQITSKRTCFVYSDHRLQRASAGQRPVFI